MIFHERWYLRNISNTSITFYSLGLLWDKRTISNTQGLNCFTVIETIYFESIGYSLSC